MKDTVYTHVGDTLTLVGDSATLIIQEGEHVTHFFGRLPNDSVCLPSLGVLLVSAIFIWLFFKNKKMEQLITKRLWLVATIIWVFGLILYWIGFNSKGCENNILALFMRASLSSIEMFVSHSDLIEVAHEWHNHRLYMLCFATVHFWAVLTSLLFVINLIGSRIFSKVRLCCWSFSRWIGRMCGVRNEKNIHVFWGIDNNAISLAKSIRKSDKEDRKKKSRFIFIGQYEADNSHGLSRFTFSHFFHSAKDKAIDFIEEIKDLDAILLKTDKVFDITTTSKCKNANIFSCLGITFLFMKPMDSLIKNSINNVSIRFYFLSDNEQKNTNGVLAMIGTNKNEEEKNKKENPYVHENFKCYCHARGNNVNKKLLSMGNIGAQVRLVDSSSLSVSQLKKDACHHPVNFVTVTENALASSPFTGLIIGFGETGRDAFRFLYEFSSFPCDDAGTDNPKRFIIVDDKIEQVKADFLKSAPALENSQSIQWIKATTNSTIFWNVLRENIDALNYIVITVKDDNDARLIAVQLADFANQYRRDLNHFRIYVRMRECKNVEFINKICDTYTYTDNRVGLIHCFGTNKGIFDTKILLIDDEEKNASEFYYAYKEMTLKNEETYPKYYKTECVRDFIKKQMQSFKDNKMGLWNYRHKYIDPQPSDENTKVVESKRKILEDFTEVYYQEEQDKSNYWHIDTKRALANVSGDASILSDAVRNNLSHCEHLRWNAKMELLGFVHGEKDMKSRKHHCLVDCITLKQKYAYTIPFDDVVVELSLTEIVKKY